MSSCHFCSPAASGTMPGSAAVRSLEDVGVGGKEDIGGFTRSAAEPSAVRS